MQLPDFPERVSVDAWIQALESLGIPVRGHQLVAVESDYSKITLTYQRETDGERHAVLSAGRNIATVAVTVALTQTEERSDVR